MMPDMTATVPNFPPGHSPFLDRPFRTGPAAPGKRGISQVNGNAGPPLP
jgi:hypothetical protein